MKIMSNNNEQNQKSGDNSTNVQVINNYNGMTCIDILKLTQEECKKIVPEIVKDNILMFRAEAEITAKTRSEEMVSSLCCKIGLIKEEQDKINNLLESFKTPAMQYNIFEAQKSYIKSGNKTQMEMLNDMLISRGLAKDQSTTQLMYDQAISYMSKLSQRHIDILSLMYIVIFVLNNDVNDIAKFKTFVNDFFSGFLYVLPIKDSELEYLDNIGVLKHFETNNYKELEFFFKNKFHELFYKGFSKEELYNAIGTTQYDIYLKASPYNKDLFRFNMPIERLKESKVIDEKKASNIVKLIEQKQMTEMQVNKIIIENCPQLKMLIENWGNKNDKQGKICKYEMTNIAIIIAQQNTTLKTKRNIKFNFKFD